jgi:LacI family transcriptional regulator
MLRAPRRRPTMHDVADAAGVSLKTVSRVVNRELGVSSDLVERVEEAVRRLQYQPDVRARNLRQTEARASSIGFAMVDVSNPFFSSILRGIEEVAATADCLVLSGSSDGDLARQDRLIDTFISQRVAGMVVVPSGDELGPIADEIVRGTPVVFLDCEPRDHHSDLVRSDHHGGAEAITRHLIRHGHSDIAFLGDDTTVFSAALRLDGFRAAMGQFGLAVRPEWVVTGHYSPIEWRSVIFDWLQSVSPQPTAIVTAQNFVTVGAVQALHSLGLQHQLAHVGFDDVELGDVVQPGISVIPQNPRLLGRRAAELLFERIAGSEKPPAHEILTESIIERGSGEIPGPGAAGPPRPLSSSTRRR